MKFDEVWGAYESKEDWKKVTEERAQSGERDASCISVQVFCDQYGENTFKDVPQQSQRGSRFVAQAKDIGRPWIA